MSTTLTTATLRSQILKDIEAVRNGKMSRAEARTLAMMTRNVLDTVKIEVTVASMKMLEINAVTLATGDPEEEDRRGVRAIK